MAFGKRTELGKFSRCRRQQRTVPGQRAVDPVGEGNGVPRFVKLAARLTPHIEEGPDHLVPHDVGMFVRPTEWDDQDF